MLVVLEDDLVDCCQAGIENDVILHSFHFSLVSGDDVVVSGVVVARWSPLFEGEMCSLDVFLLAHHVRVTNQKTSISSSPELEEQIERYWEAYRERPCMGRNFIIQSVCPQIYDSSFYVVGYFFLERFHD